MQDRPSVLCLHFGKVEFMDSSGVGLVMGRYRLLQMYGGRMELYGMPSYVKRIMLLSGIERIADILPEKGNAS